MSAHAMEMAAKLNGRQYEQEMTRADEQLAKALGLVVIFGASDDLVEIRGAAYDELGAADGTPLYFTSAGLLQNECDAERCPYHARLRDAAALVRVHFDRDGWHYKTDIPHETFAIFDGVDRMCLGIVFALADVKGGGA